MTGFSKGNRKVEVGLKWDPSPAGRPPTDLDIIAATFVSGDAYGTPAYLVHFDSRSPDGTIFLNRDSTDGRGFGWDEVMTLELDRLGSQYARVVVGVVIQQQTGHKTFADVLNPAMRVREGYTVLSEDDFASVPAATAATIAEFVRDESGRWNFHAGVHGFDEDPSTFTRVMGRAPQP
ncbi:tellurium resistance protein TerD [Streptomyces griseochromogenes]|uniref:Tellurium resistance protein TerD n=1 Tax=Streptomyces griseochromogenes TaxID=68214 RepID=A0A1B1ATP5_9ACTN|nr:TerD family protein [Streptomyces griseochromogenes]ANP49934.1 TerD-family protein [Streptomyces griseochromogenes]MBP2048479.1 tellurium resistance protein TerD [Streptomyces griseochromogenes]